MTEYKPCEVCRGREIITVPVYQSVVTPAGSEPSATLTIQNNYREFPCPACANWAETDRVKVMRSHTIMPVALKADPYAVASARRQAAHNLVDMLCKGDSFLRVAERPAAGTSAFRYDECTCYEVTIGVVSKSVVASLDERVARHQEGLAKEVIEEAIAQVKNWGSAYGQREIDKMSVYGFIRGALTTVLNRRIVREAK